METVDLKREVQSGEAAGFALRCGPDGVRPARRELLIDREPVAVERAAFEIGLPVEY